MSLRSIGVMNVLCSALDHRVRDLVALVLDLLDPLGLRLEVGRVLDHLQEGPAALDRLLPLVLEVARRRTRRAAEASWPPLYIRSGRAGPAPSRPQAALERHGEAQQELLLDLLLGRQRP